MLVASETLGLQPIMFLHACMCVALSFHGFCTLYGYLDVPCRNAHWMKMQAVLDVGNQRFRVSSAERRLLFVRNLGQEKVLSACAGDSRHCAFSSDLCFARV
jgi:hypothetical protein